MGRKPWVGRGGDRDLVAALAGLRALGDLDGDGALPPDLEAQSGGVAEAEA